MRYVNARIAQEFDDLTYRIYMSEGMYELLGSYSDRYIDIINNEWTVSEEETAEEVVARVIKQGGLTIED